MTERLSPAVCLYQPKLERCVERIFEPMPASKAVRAAEQAVQARGRWLGAGAIRVLKHSLRGLWLNLKSLMDLCGDVPYACADVKTWYS